MQQYNILILTTKSESKNILTLLGNRKTAVIDENSTSISINRQQEKFVFKFVFSATAAYIEVRKKVYDAILADASDELQVLNLTDLLSDSDYRHRLLSVRQIIVLLNSTNHNLDFILKLGRKNIGGLLEYHKTTQDELIKKIKKTSRNKSKGKTALCLAGGAIEGLIYEIGVLRALEDSMESGSILDFDMYFGISAGSVIAATLANNVPPSEIAKAFMGDSTMFEGIKPSMLYDPAFKELASKIRDFIWNGVSLHKGFKQFSELLPNAMFKGEKIEKILEKELTLPGRSNNFTDLDKELYIGATDQDTYEHILFGSDGWDHIPISRAVHASISLIPFYSPQWIAGRWFIDGSFTRTSEVKEAVKRGATLIIIIDPLIPVKSPYTGFVRGKGGVFAGIQALKALINTRFMSVLPHLTESYPDTDFFVFSPRKNDMELLSGSPIRYKYRMEIDRAAYFNALKRMNEEKERFHQALLRHGFKLKRQTL